MAKNASTAPIVVTSGDPSGVGPELTVKAWTELANEFPFVVIGDFDQFQKLSQSAPITLKKIRKPEEWSQDALCVIPHAMAEPPKAGNVQLANAGAVIEMIESSVALVKSGQASAIVTNPINKDVLKRGAGFPHPGHTEFLANLDGKDRSVMMLASPELRVVPVTIHIPLKDVKSVLTSDLLKDTIRTTYEALVRDFGITSPRIAVAGLNPHAGENGQMGCEEISLLVPALNDLKAEGIVVTGPFSADTMFHATARKSYDAAVCMYHDQALIPIKTIDFDRGVNVTLGLSFIRTSPDHGTAFDIAGQSKANPSSLIEAIKLASEMARRRASS